MLKLGIIGTVGFHMNLLQLLIRRVTITCRLCIRER